MSDRPRWQVPVLVLAILLVVGQVIVFVAIRSGSKETPIDAGSTVASAPLMQPPAQPAPPAAPAPDATVASVPVDATVERTTEPEPVPEPEPVKVAKKQTRAEILAERRREEQEAREAREAAREARLREEKERQDKERQQTELEKQRLATQKAQAEAEAAKAQAETARIEAEKAKQVVATPVPPAPQPAGPDVLVLVLGPGTPAVTAAQIRDVFLGRTTVWPNGTTARPFNRPLGTAAAKKFFGGILRMNGGDFAEHWSEIQLAGNGIPPPTAGSGASAFAKAAGTQGGFTYVMESELPANTAGVRLVRVK